MIRVSEPLSPRSTPTVEVQGVSVVYPAKEHTVTALDKVSLNIEEGEFISLIGPSGCGKTTPRRRLAGLDPLDSGEIWIGDRRVDQLEYRRQRLVARVPSDAHFEPGQSAWVHLSPKCVLTFNASTGARLS